MEVVDVTAEQTRPLRHLVLRPTQPAEAAEYPGDHDSGTRHFGAMDAGRLVGIASLYRAPRTGGPADGWRLRGMATAVDARNRGAGRALLGACRDHVAAHGGGELWCNARIVASALSPPIWRAKHPQNPHDSHARTGWEGWRGPYPGGGR